MDIDADISVIPIFWVGAKVAGWECNTVLLRPEGTRSHHFRWFQRAVRSIVIWQRITLLFGSRALLRRFCDPKPIARSQTRGSRHGVPVGVQSR